jgi:hypothetical protein
MIAAPLRYRRYPTRFVNGEPSVRVVGSSQEATHADGQSARTTAGETASTMSTAMMNLFTLYLLTLWSNACR